MVVSWHEPLAYLCTDRPTLSSLPRQARSVFSRRERSVLSLEPPGDGQPGTCAGSRRDPASLRRCAGATLGSFVGLLADAAVDPLAEQVGVAEVAGVLLDHVEYHLAQRDGSAVLHGAADGEVG